MIAPDLATSLQQFLQDILSKRIPARDIPRAEQIGAQAKQLHPDGVPADILRSWLAPSVAWLAPLPERWDKAIGMISLYLDEHIPPQKGSLSIGSTMADQLIAANQNAQAQFFSTLNDWSSMRALEPLIPSLDLAQDAALAMVSKWLAPQEPGTITGLSPRVVVSWASRHPIVAHDLIKKWRGAEARQKPFSTGAVATLIEGIMQATNGSEQGMESLSWRDQVINDLGNSMTEGDQRLAAYLSFSSWPLDTPPARQHSALLSFLKRSPIQLAPAGHNALSGVIQEDKHFSLALDTLVRISDLVEQAQPTPERWQKHLRDTAYVFWLGLSDKAANKPTVTQIDPILMTLLDLKPGLREEMRNFDYLLSSLWKLYPDYTSLFMIQWLRRHANRLSTHLEDCFVLLSGNPKGLLDRWLVKWLVDRSPDVRVWAAQVLGHREIPSLDMESIRSLKANQARALVHMLLAANMQPEPLIHLLQQIVSFYPDLADLIGDLLQNELAIDYPRASRKWVERLNKEKEIPINLLVIARRVQDQFLQRDDILENRASILPELRGTSPTLRETYSAQQEIISRSMKEHESPFMQMVTKMPIARGESSAGPRVSDIRFQHHEFKLEMAARSLLDRVTAQLLPLQHQQQAAELLQSEQDE